jgi:hypothetical protein
MLFYCLYFDHFLFFIFCDVVSLPRGLLYICSVHYFLFFAFVFPENSLSQLEKYFCSEEKKKTFSFYSIVVRTIAFGPFYIFCFSSC